MPCRSGEGDPTRGRRVWRCCTLRRTCRRTWRRTRPCMTCRIAARDSTRCRRGASRRIPRSSCRTTSRCPTSRDALGHARHTVNPGADHQTRSRRESRQQVDLADPERRIRFLKCPFSSKVKVLLKLRRVNHRCPDGALGRIKAARRCIDSSGDMTRWVVPSP